MVGYPVWVQDQAYGVLLLYGCLASKCKNEHRDQDTGAFILKYFHKDVCVSLDMHNYLPEILMWMRLTSPPGKVCLWFAN